MQNAIYTACDSCATIVDGKQGTADVKRNFLSIQGSLCLNLWNIDTDRHEFYYASQKGDVKRTAGIQIPAMEITLMTRNTKVKIVVIIALPLSLLFIPISFVWRTMLAAWDAADEYVQELMS
jgi:hypothetical protein